MGTKYMCDYEDFEEPVTDSQSSRNEQIRKVIYSGDLFSVISAYKPGDSEEVYKENHNQLQEEILRMKYAYLEMNFAYSYSDGNGMTSVKRDSLFIPEMKYGEVLALGKKYRQGTFAFGRQKELKVIRVKDEKVILVMSADDMGLAWNFFLNDQHNIPW